MQRRDQPGALGEHHVDCLVVEVDAVLDGAHAVADGRLDPVGGLGVRHDRDAGCLRLGHNHRDLVITQVRVPRVVARRQYAA